MSNRYSELTRDELIRLLERRDAMQGYGLRWEREGIEPDRAVNDDYVVLDLDPGLSTKPNEAGGWRNLVIEGDNWDALRVLRLTHAGRIRCILIDPPYNTGNKDFAYNDSFIGKDDRYRHSLWLEFLYKRLLLARDLLADDGVILVCINDENRARLDMLMEQVLPGMRIGSFVWKTRIGSNDTKGAFLSSDHEHILIYGNSNFRFGGSKKSFGMYSNTDNDPKGDWRISDLTKSHSYKERLNAFYPLQDPETKIWYPCNPLRVWAFASKARTKPGAKLQSKAMEDWIAEGRIIFPKNNRVETWHTRESLLAAIEAGDVPRSGGGLPLLRADLPDIDEWIGRPCGWGTPAFKRYKAELRNQTQPLSSWIRVASDKKADIEPDKKQMIAAFNDEGAKQIQSIFGEKAFNYAKPLSLIKNILFQSTGSDDIILDFFAGSGTTGHAVLSLNEDDNGNRRFIMVSNTEATAAEPQKNICRDVCARRLRRVIDGYGDVDGLGGDFAYLRARRVAEADILYDFDRAALWILLQLRQARDLAPYDAEALLQVSLPVAGTDDVSTLVYMPEVSEAALTELGRISGPVLVFTPTPGILRDRINRPELAIELVPDRLLMEFRHNVVGL